MLFRLITMCFFWTVLTFCHNAIADEKTVQVGVLHYPPYIIVKDDGIITGLNPEIIRTVFTHAGFKVKFKVLPFARSIKLTETGKIDAVGALDDHSPVEISLSRLPIANQIGGFFVRSDNNWQYSGIPSLDKQKVLYVRGYDYTALDPDYQNYVETSPNVSRWNPINNHIETVIRLLKNGRVDVTLEDVTVMKYMLSETKQTDVLKEAGRLKGTIGLHIGFAKNKRGNKLLEAFNQSHSELMASGKINPVFKKFNIPQIAPAKQ
ncbi:exported hypothetical protein [Candidatus Terasakiella magnetica]|uniref:Solute-binding protein family 3/N-terminal domain-containing protein n=1 Tax=Candidatus Terasakiella magnetica TaxID=1867952 RepID=A0A1C3RFC9_9PROT|nr:transporter substrate-binding domain-containing protein [Candidatus Terasakiella magnetica]SCA55969.1 exported hypothetical protein [Candidatus Terasakiella magnetica]